MIYESTEIVEVLKNIGKAIEANTAAIEAAGNKVANSALVTKLARQESVAREKPKVGDPVTLSFGKHRGKVLRDIDPDYFSWFLQQEWAEEKFPDDLRAVTVYRALKAGNATSSMYKINGDGDLVVAELPF